MLAEAPFAADIPVRNLEEARQFYEDVLGLTPTRLSEMDITFRSGDALFAIYPTELAGKAEHTLGTFLVEDVDAAVSELRSRGITFEEYDFPGLKTVNGIAQVGPDRVAWFKDPDGNLLSVGQMGA